MVERILEQESALRQVLGADRIISHSIPSWQDIDVLESVNKTLGPCKSLLTSCLGRGMSLFQSASGF